MAVGVFSISRIARVMSRASGTRSRIFQKSLLLIGFGLVAVVTNFAKADGPPAEHGAPHDPLTFRQRVEDGPVGMTVTVGPTTAQVAEPIELTIEIQAPEEVAIAWPPYKDKAGPFEVVHAQIVPDVPTSDGRRLWLRKYKLESLVSGEQTIPPVVVGYADRRQDPPDSGAARSSEIPIQITTLLEGQADPRRFRDIKGVVELAAPPRRVVPWVIGATTIGVAVVVAKTVGGSAIFAAIAAAIGGCRVTPKQSANQWALDALQQLEESPLLEHGPAQAFHDRLTRIVLEYLERQFGIHTADQTTDELLQAVQRHGALEQGQSDAVVGLLEMADRVKFARYETAFVDHQQALLAARQLVEQTSSPSRSGEPTHHSGGVV